jgi:deoxyadenosine/deoxycytidine kinase
MASPALTYIVVSGNSGAGKSTLVKALGEHLRGRGAAVQLCDEREFHHPLLQNMFHDPAPWALPIQLNFATQRAARLLQVAAQAGPGDTLLMERCLWEDRLFFEYYVRQGAIDRAVQPAYERVLVELIRATARPSVVIHLRGSTDSLYRRLDNAYATGQRPVELLGPNLRAYLDGMNEIYGAWPADTAFAGHYVEYDIDEPGYSTAAVVAGLSTLPALRAA